MLWRDKTIRMPQNIILFQQIRIRHFLPRQLIPLWGLTVPVPAAHVQGIPVPMDAEVHAQGLCRQIVPVPAAHVQGILVLMDAEVHAQGLRRQIVPVPAAHV